MDEKTSTTTTRNDHSYCTTRFTALTTLLLQMTVEPFTQPRTKKCRTRALVVRFTTWGHQVPHMRTKRPYLRYEVRIPARHDKNATVGWATVS